MNAWHYAACDLGGESGRVIVGTLADGKLTLDEIHRFPTGASRVAGTLRWNVLRIFEEIKTGLRAAVGKYPDLVSVSVDSWGVDYVYFRKDEPLVALPFQYRDSRTEACYAEAMKTDSELIFAETGIQFMHINTLYQMIDDTASRRAVVGISDQFLTIADYFNYLLSGVARNEESLASTTQIYNPSKREWSGPLIEHYHLERRLFPQVVPSGTRLGPIRPEIGLGNTTVVSGCSHDTAASVAAVPAREGDDWAYLSSGTWSLAGVELDKPLINDAARKANFTNEVGYGGSIRFLKNITGLWIIQECRRNWQQLGQEFSYAEITHLAGKAAPLRSIIHPNDSRFLKPDDMVEKVQAFCRETGQLVPETAGEIARTVYESLALLYAHSLDVLETLTQRKINTLHIVGGGSQSHLLNQFTANATERTVIAGPVESTAAGNILVQALANGHLHSLAELRETVQASFPTQMFSPTDHDSWREATARFSKLTHQ
ncbi:MAG TPA: rhamnulokinase family protein [Chthoniobacterales bacterium]